MLFFKATVYQLGIKPSLLLHPLQKRNCIWRSQRCSMRFFPTFVTHYTNQSPTQKLDSITHSYIYTHPCPPLSTKLHTSVRFTSVLLHFSPSIAPWQCNRCTENQNIEFFFPLKRALWKKFKPCLTAALDNSTLRCSKEHSAHQRLTGRLGLEGPLETIQLHSQPWAGMPPQVPHWLHQELCFCYCTLFCHT